MPLAKWHYIVISVLEKPEERKLANKRKYDKSDNSRKEEEEEDKQLIKMNS